MKKYAVFVLLMTSAVLVLAQNRETRDVPSFTRISYRVPGTLILKQGSPQKVELEGPKNVLQEVDTEVSGNRLTIGKEDKWMDWNWGEMDKIKVFITVPSIEGISVSGSGDLLAEDKITAGNLDLNVSGSGSMRVAFAATGNVEADVSGSGEIDLKGSCSNFDSDVSGSGKVFASLAIQDLADFGISGSGKIEVQGSAKKTKASITGSGRVNAGNLTVETCDIRISGSGDMEINVKEELEANITGSGNVTYTGDPKRVNSHASGSGNVRKR